jgi:hypothetical protein
MKRLSMAVLCLLAFCPAVRAATSVSQYGITWTFDRDYAVGRFCTGDYWVVGPIRIKKISTDLHAAGFIPGPGQDGSMVNPNGGDKEGYDNRLNCNGVSSYDAALNAALPNGKPIAPGNPLVLAPNSSLVSMVSWLCKSPTEKEPGTPAIAGYSKAPRSMTRSGAILTVLAGPPPEGSFRPPYCGSDKSVKFNVSQLDRSQLRNLDPPAGTPDPAELAKHIERPWIDHVHEWLGADVHPTENMPNYGREIAATIGMSAVILHLDFSKLPGKPSKDTLLIEFVQLGIDCAGVADNGGGWPNNGGHGEGRKLPILFAGILLNDAHMKQVGTWKTRFQEDEQTFYVSQADVELTHSKRWHPDVRQNTPTPYETKDIGLAEWACARVGPPPAVCANANWDVPYRAMNSANDPGLVLAARIMGQQQAWNHPALFDYTDRWMKQFHGVQGICRTPKFIVDLWTSASTGATAPLR